MRDSDTNCSWCVCNGPKRFGKESKQVTGTCLHVLGYLNSTLFGMASILPLIPCSPNYCFQILCNDSKRFSNTSYHWNLHVPQLVSALWQDLSISPVSCFILYSLGGQLERHRPLVDKFFHLLNYIYVLSLDMEWEIRLYLNALAIIFLPLLIFKPI